MEKESGGGGGSLYGKRWPESVANARAGVDQFYEKLSKLNESSGLSLLFNFRRTVFDLHCLYNEVIKRGGFYQVTKKGKWEDVASVSNSKSCVSLSAAQLRNVYEMLLLQYELMYSHNQAQKWPPKNSLAPFGSGATPSCTTGKRKHLQEETKGVETVNWNSTMSISVPNSNVRELMAENVPKAPQKPRTGYLIFLRLESDRLRKIHGESSATLNLRGMASDAWRRLSEKEKLPFMEAGKMDKERYKKEMDAYMQLQEKQNSKSQNMLNFSTSKEPNDDVYRVSLEDESENLLSPDGTALKMAIEAMKKAESTESIFEIENWDNNTPS